MWRQRLEISTPGRGLFDITRRIQHALPDLAEGLVHLFIQHTSCSLVVQENADPDVLTDLEGWMARHIPDGDPRFRHDAEGPDDMPAHIRAALTATSLTLPIHQGRLDLGTWQAVYLYEHRHAPHRRRIVLTGWSSHPS